jgi:hypothetical protein
VVDRFALEIFINKLERLGGKIVDADTIRFRLLFQSNLRDILNTQCKEIIYY